jgi:hypothetical protein
MRALPAIEVPPNFITMRGMRLLRHSSESWNLFSFAAHKFKGDSGFRRNDGVGP